MPKLVTLTHKKTATSILLIAVFQYFKLYFLAMPLFEKLQCLGYYRDGKPLLTYSASEFFKIDLKFL
jgi:hypothetical protein